LYIGNRSRADCTETEDDNGAEEITLPSVSVARSRELPGATVPGFQNCMTTSDLREDVKVKHNREAATQLCAAGSHVASPITCEVYPKQILGARPARPLFSSCHSGPNSSVWDLRSQGQSRRSRSSTQRLQYKCVP